MYTPKGKVEGDALSSHFSAAPESSPFCPLFAVCVIASGCTGRLILVERREQYNEMNMNIKSSKNSQDANIMHLFSAS